MDVVGNITNPFSVIIRRFINTISIDIILSIEK